MVELSELIGVDPWLNKKAPALMLGDSGFDSLGLYQLSSSLIGFVPSFTGAPAMPFDELPFNAVKNIGNGTKYTVIHSGLL